MRRRRFDHLFEEISIRIGQLAPRYALWLHLREQGLDPDLLTREQVVAFCRDDLAGFLGAAGLALAPRSAQALQRAVARFDPARRTPEEWAAGW